MNATKEKLTRLHARSDGGWQWQHSQALVDRRGQPPAFSFDFPTFLLQHRRGKAVNMRTPLVCCGIALAVLMVGCTRPAPSTTFTVPTSPTVPVLSIAPSGAKTLLGIITDSASGMPIQGVRVYLSSGRASVASDALGQYEIDGLLNAENLRWARGTLNGYLQQCTAPVLLDRISTTLNIQLTREANLSFTEPSPGFSPPPNTRTVTGVLFRTIDGRRQPVAGGFVDFEPEKDYEAAGTRTDASGRYLLCGLPKSPVKLGASSAPSDVVYVTGGAGADTVLDIELK